MSWFNQLFCSGELYQIKELESRIENLQEEKIVEGDMEAFFNNKYPKTDIFYAGRSTPSIHGNVKLDVRNFFNLYDAQVRDVANNIATEDTDDKTALNCLSWVIDNIKYVLDTTKGATEYWQFSYETLKFKTGDCEDGAILLANLMISKGIPYWKIRLTAGSVKGGGHAYLVYFCVAEERWVILDWCYWPNKLPINTRKDYKDEDNYYGVWFSWNTKYAYSKGLNTDAKAILK